MKEKGVVRHKSGSAEGRSAPRRRTRLQSARLFHADTGARLCDAAVRDISATGMQLVLAHTCLLPVHFDVYLDNSPDAAVCTVAWRRERTVGVRIIGKPSVRHRRQQPI